MSNNLFNYEFVNNSGKSLSFRGPYGTQEKLAPKGKVKITLDSTSPVPTRVWFAKAKKIFIRLDDLIPMMRDINSQLKQVSNFTYDIENPMSANTDPVEPMKYVDELAKNLVKSDTMKRIWVEDFNPVMVVGEGQDLHIGKEGIDSFRGLKITSSDASKVVVAGRRIIARFPGDVVINIKLQGLETSLNLQIVTAL